MRLDALVTELDGVGPKKAQALKQLGIKTIDDLIHHYPSRVEFPPGPAPLQGLARGSIVTVAGTVLRSKMYEYSNVFDCMILNTFGEEIHIKWYNAGYLYRRIREGTRLVACGLVDDPGMCNPRFKTLPTHGDLTTNAKAAMPHLRKIIYPVVAGITSKEISKFIHQVATYIPPTLQQIHDPESRAIYTDAIDKEKYDELFYMQLALAMHKQTKDRATANVRCVPVNIDLTRYFPFTFTPDQERAISDIVRDMGGDNSMNRLLQGDVGSGKTVVAAYAAMITACNGGQTAILCPTEVLARQHYAVVRGWFKEAGLRCRLTIGGLTAARMGPFKAVAGDPDVVIGTTALLSETTSPQFNNLGLVIIDEQHKFGVGQRAALQKHGNPHVLLMSATPIPRTIAMTAFGDLDVSTIKTMPPGRLPVITEWIRTGAHQEAMTDVIHCELDMGNRVYVVCPRIEALDDEMRAVEEVAKEYINQFPTAVVGVMHGQMSGEARELTAQWWATPGITGKILVATTVVEVGIDNPNATVMVVEGAERFGLAQLHQLRGRVGRSDKQSYCFLLSDTESSTGHSRLKIMEQTNDGFEIAEHDLKMRGPGDILSTRQHGMPDLKLADLVEDFDLMVEARERAQNFATSGNIDYIPYMYHIGELQRRFPEYLTLGSVG